MAETENTVDPQRTTEILRGLSYIMKNETTRFGSSPNRVFEFMNAVAVCVGAMIASAPDRTRAREWFVDALDKNITGARQHADAQPGN